MIFRAFHINIPRIYITVIKIFVYLQRGTVIVNSKYNTIFVINNIFL